MVQEASRSMQRSTLKCLAGLACRKVEGNKGYLVFSRGGSKGGKTPCSISSCCCNLKVDYRNTGFGPRKYYISSLGHGSHFSGDYSLQTGIWYLSCGVGLYIQNSEDALSDAVRARARKFESEKSSQKTSANHGNRRSIGKTVRATSVDSTRAGGNSRATGQGALARSGGGSGVASGVRAGNTGVVAGLVGVCVAACWAVVGDVHRLEVHDEGTSGIISLATRPFCKTR